MSRRAFEVGSPAAPAHPATTTLPVPPVRRASRPVLRKAQDRNGRTNLLERLAGYRPTAGTVDADVAAAGGGTGPAPASSRHARPARSGFDRRGSLPRAPPDRRRRGGAALDRRRPRGHPGQHNQRQRRGSRGHGRASRMTPPSADDGQYGTATTQIDLSTRTATALEGPDANCATELRSARTGHRELARGSQSGCAVFHFRAGHPSMGGAAARLHRRPADERRRADSYFQGSTFRSPRR